MLWDDFPFLAYLSWSELMKRKIQQNAEKKHLLFLIHTECGTDMVHPL